MANMLVTGGAGFIGSNLVDRLLDEGHDVTVVDDLSTGKLDNLADARRAAGARLHVEHMDIATEDLDAVVAHAAPQVVFHLAAQIDVRRSVEDPLHDARVNLLGTIRLLEAGRRARVGKVIVTSSGGCIYGEPDLADLPLAEDHPGHPQSPYGASKRALEEYMHTYAALYGLRWTSLALGNVLGPRQDPFGEAGVVAIFGSRMLAGEPVTIFGDGEQTRDFVFVDDVADALLAAVDRADGLRCNIGTGERTSVNGLFAALADIVGYERSPEYAPERPGELRHIALDAGLAARELGWKPRHDLREALERTVAWLRA